MSEILDKLNLLKENLDSLNKKIESTNLENDLLKTQQSQLVSEKSELIKKNELAKSHLKALLERVDNGQDISVMCTEDEKNILLKSRDRIVEEAERVKSQTKNVGHDYFLILVLLNIAGSEIKSAIKLSELETVECELDRINQKVIEKLK
jgi:uncharacterized protein (TIGR02449 family)